MQRHDDKENFTTESRSGRSTADYCEEPYSSNQITAAEFYRSACVAFLKCIRLGSINIKMPLFLYRLIQLSHQTNMTKVQDKTIVIIGGGYAGSNVAKELERKAPSNYRILLIEKVRFSLSFLF